MTDKKYFYPKRFYYSLLCMVLTTMGCVSLKKDSSDRKIITREEWGSTPLTDSIETHHINRLTIHHGGEYFNADQDVREYLRNLQSWSRKEKGWIDIPYHYLMDMDGTLYEGRPDHFPGDTNTDYDPRGHLLICIIGNFEEQMLRTVQYENLVNWLDYFCSSHNIPADSIKGHKDYTDTLCPGRNIYKHLKSGQLINDVKNFE